MSSSKEEQLWNAASAGDLDLVTHLSAASSLDVNWIGPERGDASLHRDCRFGHLQIVQVLLKHPQIDVNLANAGGGTAVNLAGQEGHVEVVKLLTADIRIEVNWQANGGARSGLPTQI